MTMLTDQRLLMTALRLALCIGAALMAAGPLFLGSNQLIVLTQFFSLLVIALMWNLLAGYVDIVTVGQHAFVGTGAYALYGLAVLLHLDLYLAIALAGVVVLLVAVPAMALVFRLRLAYLAVASWVIAEVLMLIAGKLPGFGGGSGVSLPVGVVRAIGSRPEARYATIYWLSFVLAVLAFAATYLLLRSRIGLGLTAMRDDEEGAGAVGVNLTRARILCFLGTAPFLGLAGALITLQKWRISPAASFSITDWTVYVIFIVVIGGIGSLEGPIVGTIMFFILREYLADLGTWYLILLGSLSILTMLVEPRGLWGLARRILREDIVPTSHRPTVGRRTAGKPSLAPSQGRNSLEPHPGAPSPLVHSK